MKNVIKKIAAVAMAFTMLGTGTAITETIAPKTNNSIVASAASYAPSTCKHSGSTRKSYSNKWYVGTVEEGVISFDVYKRYVYTHCSKCGYVLYTQVETLFS